MATSGVHITCGVIVGSDSRFGGVLQGRRWWSQTMTSAGTTTNGSNSQDGHMRIRNLKTTGIWYAIGQNPNASNSPRFYLGGGEYEDHIVDQGDKCAWIDDT